MSKDDKKDAPKVDIKPALPVSEPMPQTGCVVCGQYTGKLVGVTTQARAHEGCAAERPDLIAKAKARA